MFCLLATAVLLCLAGCSPPGPRALLEGKKLIDEGRAAEAVGRLEKAVELLPRNALAWNYLGLAYHANHQLEQAAKAYRIALSLDYKLNAVRYNLGCLYLEQENFPAAIDELRSYTLLQPGAIDGWLKQGAALLRARRLDEAEKSFRSALEIQAKHPEALNGLGLIQVQRRRLQEALNHFNVAALQDPPYAPAVLNSAVLHQQLNHRSAALQRYRQYLALQPPGADLDSIAALVRQLEQESSPAQLVSRPSVAPRTNATLAFLNSPPPRTVAVTPALRTNPPPATASKPLVPVPSPNTNASLASVRGTLETIRTPPRPAPAKGAEALAARPPEIEVAQVQPEFVVKPAQDLPRTTAAPPPDRAPIVDSPPESAKLATNGPKRGFFSRLNPFGGRTKSDNGPAVGVAPAEPLASSPPVFARFSYLSPAPPTPGNRVESEKSFNRGLKAQRSGSRSLAITEYQAAVKADPANYDAYYNLGLAALESGDVRLSLWAYEIALALKPGAEDARYNFALALKAGGYAYDAVDQLEKLTAANPSDARAHLSLANLYAQQLQKPLLARDHYERVLELNPRHPEAAKIRYWLAANP